MQQPPTQQSGLATALTAANQPPLPPRFRRRRRTGRRPGRRFRRALDRERQRGVRLVAGLRRIQDEVPEAEELVEKIIKADREFQDGHGA